MATTPPKLPAAATNLEAAVTSAATNLAATSVATNLATTTNTAVAAPTTFPVSGTSPTATVTVPNQSGVVTFQLVVTDNLGQQSAPATVTVTIQGGPTAVITASPTTVKPGQAITLSGAGSTAAAPGTITNFTFSVNTPK